ncbi:MAG: hypothetical protein ACJ781_18340, partial [Myxococcales bacterium]
MRPTSPCILVAVLLAACGPVDTGSGSSAPFADGGPVWSGGGAPDAPDAGTPAPPDAGNPPAPSACDGIVPSSN